MLRAVAIFAMAEKIIKNKQRRRAGTARWHEGARQWLRPPITLILTHQHGLKTLIGSWIMQVDLNWTYLVSSIAAEVVCDLSWGLPG